MNSSYYYILRVDLSSKEMKQLSPKNLKKFIRTTNHHNRNIFVILEKIDYAKNVAGIFRTCDAVGINTLYLTDGTRTPPFGKGLQKASRKKERVVKWKYHDDTLELIAKLKSEGWFVIAIELTDESFPVTELSQKISDKEKVAFVVGSEVNGVRKFTLEACDAGVYIPMYGKGASLNVHVALAVTLYQAIL